MIQEGRWSVSEGHDFTEEPAPARGSTTARQYDAKADAIVAMGGIMGEHVHSATLQIGMQSGGQAS
jgi:hypothetical protein